MSEIRKGGAQFIGCEYKEIDPKEKYASLRLDCYPSFGWTADERLQGDNQVPCGKIVLRRERKIANKMELTRLQRHFEVCLNEIAALEKSKTAKATMWAIAVGLIGTAFMAGATFAAVHEPPLILLSILLAVPGFLGWALPYFLYQKLVVERAKVVAELVEQKYDEIYEICEQGNKLRN